MSEGEKDLVNNIKNIKKGKVYGLTIPDFSGLTDSNLSGLLEKVSKKEELEAFPDFVGGYIQPKELEILLSKNIIDSDGKTKNALSFLPENFLSQINKNIFLNLPDEYLQLITPEQFKLLPEKAAMQLAKDNRLQYLSNEVIKSLELQSLNLYHKYSANITSDRLTEEELKAQLNSLIEAEKLQYLPKEIIGTITDEIIKGLGADFIKQLSAETLDYLATVKGDGLIITNQKICAIDINLVPIDKFEALSPETIKALSVEQIKALDTNHLSALKKKPELINALGNNFAAISDVTGLDINSLSEATLKNVTNEQFKQFGIEQFKALCDAGKFKYLKPEIIEQIPNDYLVYAVERGLTNEQASHLNKEQFELIFNQNRGNIIIPEIIPSLRADVISANQEFLKNLTAEQAENLTAEQVKSIQKNGLLNILSDDVLFSVVNKIKDNLKELDEDVLTRVARNKSINSQIPILDSEPVLTNFSVDFKSEENQIFNIKDIGATIKKRIEDEDWERLSSDCFFWCKDKKQKSEIYEILKEEINSQKTTVYGLIDKIQLLSIVLPLAQDDKQLNSDYRDLEKTIELLVNEPCYTVDEYFSKSDLFTSIINNNDIDTELREIICQEQIKLTENDFVKKFYTKSGRNSLHNLLKEEISKAYLNYANILLEKYKIDTNKFEKELSADEERNLTKNEREYYNCIKKVYEYTPDLESKIRYWTATGTRVAAKVAATYFLAKTAANSSSKIVSAASGVGAAAVGINTAIDASDVLEQFSTLNNRKEVHEKKRKEKLGFFARLKRFFGRIFKKKEYRGLSTNGLSQRAKTCYKNTIKKEKEKKLTLLRDEVKTIEDTMLETLKNKKGKSKQNQLIEDTIELRAEALKLIAQKKAMALKKEYPEFEEKKGISGIFSKLKDIGKNILNGVVTGVLDTASLGYGGNVYKQLVDGKSDEEKVKIESRLIAFQKKVAEIDSWLVDELNSLRHEECHRLASANEADKQKLEEFKRNIESKEREIDQEMEVFVPEQHAELDKNGLLPSLSKKESLDTISEDLEVLIHDENVSPELKIQNVEKVNEMLETKSRSGNLNLQDQEIAKNVSTILVAMNQFIAAQLVTACAIAVTNEMANRKRQELEREQARINDMQAKMQESGIDPLALNNGQAALAF